MIDKILKIIKAFVIPLSVICLIALVLLLNMILLDFINGKQKMAKVDSVINTKYSKNIQGSLVTATKLSTEEKSIPINTSNGKIVENNININPQGSLVNDIFNQDYTTSPNKLGVNMHWAVREDPCKDITLNEVIYQGNIKFVREEFNWESIEPNKGQRDYSRYDSIMENYQHYGVEVLGLLAYSTDWSAQAPGNILNKEFYPPNIDEWNKFVRETVGRYKNDVSTWEIWNEPNDSNFFKGTRQQYYELLRNTYQIIKKIDPDAKIISGGTTWPDYKYSEDFYQNGLGNFIDGYGVHAYYCDQSTNSSNYNKLAEDLANVVNISNQNNKPVWITEFGCSSYEIGQKKQADNLAYMMTLFNSAPDIEKVFWYSLRDDSLKNGQEGAYGLITSDMVLKQSFLAFKHFNP